MSYNINLSLIQGIINERISHNPYLSLERGSGTYVDAYVDEVSVTSYMSGDKVYRIITVIATPLNIASTATDKGIEIILEEKDFIDTTVTNIKEIAFDLLTTRGSIQLVNNLYGSNQYEEI